MLSTTLELIKNHDPCMLNWEKLLNGLGTDYPSDKPLNLLTILKINGIDDTIWTLRVTQEDPRGIAVRFAYGCALEVLPIFEKKYPENEQLRETLILVKRYIDRDEIPEGKMKAMLDTSYATMKEAENAAQMASYLSHQGLKAAYMATYASFEAIYATETDTVHIPAELAAKAYEMAEAYEMADPYKIVEATDPTKTFLTRLLTKLLKEEE